MMDALRQNLASYSQILKISNTDYKNKFVTNIVEMYENSVVWFIMVDISLFNED
jgi:hypothetical protein